MGGLFLCLSGWVGGWVGGFLPVGVEEGHVDALDFLEAEGEELAVYPGPVGVGGWVGGWVGDKLER